VLVVPPEQRRHRYERLGPRIQFEGNLIASRFVGVCALHRIVGTILPQRGSDSLVDSNLTESSLSDLPKIPLKIPIFR